MVETAALIWSGANVEWSRGQWELSIPVSPPLDERQRWTVQDVLDDYLTDVFDDFVRVEAELHQVTVQSSAEMIFQPPARMHMFIQGGYSNAIERVRKSREWQGKEGVGWIESLREGPSS